MKRIIFVCTIILGLLATACTTTKITNENIFKPGAYESKTNGELRDYYVFYESEKGGTINTKDGMTGIPFRFDVVKINGNTADIIFHMADESDNTEATVTMKNENEYTIKYADKVDELKFIAADLTQLESYFEINSAN